MKLDGAHEFALFVDAESLKYTASANTVQIIDHQVIVRITTILRLKVGEHITLFTPEKSYRCVITGLHKRHLDLRCDSIESIVPVQPALSVVVPLLERDALESVIYMATVHGVQTIHLVTTQKSRKSFTEKDYTRLSKIAHAAGEQAKQFFMPNIVMPVGLEQFLSQNISAYAGYQKLWCDVSGKPILEHKKPTQKNLLILGPEGDFTIEEKKLLSTLFTPVRLTASVLRACDAAALALGIMRV